MLADKLHVPYSEALTTAVRYFSITADRIAGIELSEHDLSVMT